MIPLVGGATYLASAFLMVRTPCGHRVSFLLERVTNTFFHKSVLFVDYPVARRSRLQMENVGLRLLRFLFLMLRSGRSAWRSFLTRTLGDTAASAPAEPPPATE